MLNITIQRVGETLVVNLIGRFDGLGAGIFDEEITPLTPVNKSLLLDFTQVKFLSSAGIRSLLTIHRVLHANGGGITLCGVDESCLKVLEISGLASRFPMYPSVDEALDALCKTCGREESMQVGDRTYSARKFSGAGSNIDIWDGDAMEKITLDELTFAMGTGAMGNNRQQAQLNAGIFIATPGMFIVKPDDLPSDFLVTNDPQKTEVWLSKAVEVSGNPDMLIGIDQPVTLLDLLRDIRHITDHAETIAYVGFLDTTLFMGFLSAESGELHKNLHDLKLLPPKHGIKLLETRLESIEDIKAAIRQNTTLDNVLEMVELPLSTRGQHAVVWVFLPKDVREASEKRLSIEYESEDDADPRNDVIIRRIYRDCSRVVLKRLTGGFTSKTYRVIGYDHLGRKLLPSVLKLGSPEVTRSEVEGCTRFVKPFIHNNSTTIMGAHYEEEWAGLRYNFLGINGPESQLTMFTDIFRRGNLDMSMKILDRVFTKILKPWYGQPRWEEIFIYRDHDPRKLFKGLLDAAEKELGIDIAQQEIYVPELDEKLVNPYWFLANHYDHDAKIQWYSCPIHGDLNMQNILLDEKENIYIIDFSETKIRNATSDFARLEPIVKTEFNRIETEEDLIRLVQFEKALWTQRNLGDAVPYHNCDENPDLNKAWEVIRLMRSYADRVTIFETDMVPYILAVLEWTLPIVCYVNVGALAKRFSMISAALMCQRIMESGLDQYL